MDFVSFGQKGGSRSTSGWRHAAHVNSAVLVTMTVTMVCCLVVSTAQTKGLNKANMFFDGTCDSGSAAKLNVGLHLVLNVVSTAVFASSNFFMQVLNSPSRAEVDASHAAGTYLGIGVPSVRNAFRVSRFKTGCWLVLLLSSIPMHLLFNSMIFQTDNRTSDYHLTIANADFVHGAQHYAPGASLIPSAFYLTPNETFMNESYIWYELGWGSQVVIGDYKNPGSEIRKNISNAAINGINWDKISAADCYNTYASCDGLRTHDNVIIVANTNFSWVRDELWHLKSNDGEYWDPMVPGNESNSLWFDAQCTMNAIYSPAFGVQCDNTCVNVMKGPNNYDATKTKLVAGSNWTFPFFNHLFPAAATDEDLDYWNFTIAISAERDAIPPQHIIVDKKTSGFVPESSTMTVDYCLVQPVVAVCHVGLSNTLLLGVTICVLVKTLTAVLVTTVLSRHGQDPLVTLGDAIASFIRHPDKHTAGMCTVDQTEMRRATRSSHHLVLAGARKWHGKIYRRWKVVPLTVWATSYLLFAVGISICGGFFGTTYHDSGYLGNFLESDTNSFVQNVSWTFTTGVLTANSPQLLLSFCYLAYNNMFTRLQMAKEWSQFRSGFHALRVTDPVGDQFSTYRLQLPYKYSIPLIICSIALHWILSNTIYLFIVQGGYYNEETFRTAQDPSLPENTVVALGYSVMALLVLLIVCCVLICVPVVLSYQKLPGDIVNVGSNSIAISAACHVSPEANVASESDTFCPGYSPPGSSRVSLASKFEMVPPAYSPLRNVGDPHSDNGDALDWGGGGGGGGGRRVSHQARGSLSGAAAGGGDGIEMQQLIKSGSMVSMRSEYSRGQLTKEALFEQISRSKIRWGVIRMPPDFYQEFGCAEPYEHLGFGVEGEEVSPPQYGKYYA